MRRKVGTALHEHLVVRLKALADSEHRSMNGIIEEALERYLARKERGAEASLVAATAGSYEVSDRQFRQVMEEERHGAD